MQRPRTGDVPDTTAGTDEDRRLVLLAREGDRGAFSRLVQKYAGLVRALVRARLRRRAEGEDVAQDVFLLAWKRLPSLAEPERFAGWISTIAVNRALEVLRRNDRRRTTSLEAAEVDPPDTRTDGPAAGAAASGLEREEEVERMMRCLGRLDERTQAVLLLRFREEHAVKDIAVSLGEQPPAVAMRISRGLRKLRAMLEGEGGA